jgi:hypothetical protein
VNAGLAAVGLLRKCVAAGTLDLNKKEAVWLSRIESELQSLPGDEAGLLAEMKQTHVGVFDPASYGLV